jgi:Mn2+/Fe2+ NRAMP family transporter
VANEESASNDSNRVLRFVRILGPGLITGASDDDPSGIVTYAITGARLGMAALWTPLFTLPLMTTIQYIAAKIGLTSGTGVARALRDAYGRAWLVYGIAVFVFVVNAINLGADLGAIAAAVNLLVPIPALWLIPPVTLAMAVILLFASYRLISSVFKWLTLALLAYVASALLSHPDVVAALKATVVPHMDLSSPSLSVLVAVLGTTISPYMWFWQASEEVEEEIAQGKERLEERRGESAGALRLSFYDTLTGMVTSNVVMYFIILATAVTLHQAGKTDIKTARDAAEALRPLAGNLSSLLFSVGVIGAGVLAVPVLAGSAAFAVGDAFEWTVGLDQTPRQAKAFYGVIVVAMLVGMGLNYVGVSPINLLFYTALIFGFLSPPVMVLLMLLSNNTKVVGERRNSHLTNILGWLTTLVMTLAAIATLITL